MPPSPAGAPTRGYRPRASSNPLKSIVEDSLEDLLRLWDERFRERYGPLRPRVRGLLEMMLRREKITQQTVESMKAWPHSGFQANWQRKIETEDRAGLQGLLSYMDRAPVSLRRLTYQDDELVHYRGTKVHPRLGTDHQLLSPVDFLAMLVPHTMTLRYEVTIRCYGAASTTTRRRLGWILQPPVHRPPPESLPAEEVVEGLGPQAGAAHSNCR